MKLLLLSAAIGAATGARVPGVRSAPLTLLRTARRREALPSVADASDALGGVLDAVNESFTKVSTALGAIDSACLAELALVAVRAQSRDTDVQTLDGLRLENLAEVGGLQAELNHLDKSESQTKASYDSTVAERASEASAYADWQAASTQQEKVLSGVLSILKERRDAAAALGSGCGSASSSGSALNYIIGVIQNLLSTVSQTIEDEASAYAVKNSQLLDLVGTHLASLERVAGESSTKAVRLSVVRAAVAHLATEGEILREGGAADESAATALHQLCGAGGEAQGALAVLGQGFQTLKTQVEQILLSLDEIQQQDKSTGGAGLLQMTPSSRLATFGRVPPQRAAKWLAAARARGLAPFKAPVLHLQHRRERSKLDVTSGGGHLRAGAVAAEAAPTPSPLLAMLNTTEECAQKKQQLAAELLVSRQAERQHLSVAAEAAALVDAVGRWLVLLEERASATTAAVEALDATWRVPLHLQQQGSDVTHASATTLCTSQGGRLCRAGELCPHGNLSAGPAGAGLAGTHWAPVGDASNEWLHVGTLQFSKCQLASGVLEQLSWLASDAPDPSKGEVYCCEATLPLDAVVGQTGLASVLADALQEVEQVKANLTTYAADSSASPLAATLPAAVASIVGTLTATKDQLTHDADSLLNVYRDLQGQYSSAAAVIQQNKSTFLAERDAANETWRSALEAAQAENSTQSSILAQQLVLHAHCENVSRGLFPDRDSHAGNTSESTSIGNFTHENATLHGGNFTHENATLEGGNLTDENGTSHAGNSSSA